MTNVGNVSLNVTISDADVEKEVAKVSAAIEKLNSTVAGKINRAIADVDKALSSLKRNTKDLRLFPHADQEVRRLEQLKASLKGLLGQQTRGTQTAGGVFGIEGLAAGIQAAFAQIPTRIRQIRAEAKGIAQDFKGGVIPPEFQQRLRDLSAELRILGEQSGVENLGKFTKSVDDAAAGTGLFDRAMDSMNGVLEKFNLNVSGIAVLLGAGFAGGLAGIIKIAIDLGGALNRFIGDAVELERQVDLTFGDASDSVRDFAGTVSRETGRTRSELLATANAFGAVARAAAIPEDQADEFAKVLTNIAAQLEGRLPGIKGIQASSELLQQAIKGDTDALATLGFTFQEVTEVSLREFGRLPDQLTVVEQAILGIRLGNQAATEATQEGGKKQESFWDGVKRKVDGVRGAIEDVFSEDSEERFNRVAANVEQLASGLETFRRSGKLGPLDSPIITREAALNNLRKDVTRLSEEELAALRKEANGHADIQAVIDREVASRKSGTDATNDQTDALIDQINVQKQNEDLFLSNTNAMRQAEDAVRSLQRAEIDGNRNVREAVIQLQRAREDAAFRETEVRRQTAREIEDANRDLAEAEIDLERAREDRQRKIRDFNIEHNRKMADINREHNRKLEDFAEKEKDIRDQNLRDFTENLVAIEAAQRKGDAEAENAARRALVRTSAAAKESTEDLERERIRELEDFRRDRDRERADRIRELGDLEIETNREIFDANRDVTEALIERQRAVEDAILELQKLEVENSRALRDAAKGIEDANRDMQRSIDDADRALERLAEDYSLSVERVKELVGLHIKWGDELHRINSETATFLDMVERLSNQTGRPIEGLGSPIGILQHGGLARANQLSLVGEKGPELIIPRSNSTVVSNNQLMEMLRQLFANANARQPLRTPVVTVNQVANDPEATAFAVFSRLTQGL